MRCPTCGTDNVPDSRFCGVCGTKLAPAESRVAPTAKIPDDAPFPPHYGAQAPYTPPPSIPPGVYQTGPATLPPRPAQAPGSIPPQNNYQSGPASIPPNTYQAPASIPPQNNYQPASIPPNTYRAPVAAPSVSMAAVPRRSLGLIILVLILDAGLATAGAIMLQRGLQKPDVVEPAPAPAPVAPKAATVTPVPAPSPVVAANIEAIANGSAGSGSAVATPPTPVVVKKAAPAKTAPAPQDPYDTDKNLHGEIELAAARSKDEFNKCREDVGGPVRGRVDLNYTVETDGRVDRVRISFNSTGSQTFASCLQLAVSRWAFATHPSQATDFMRPFIY